MIRLKSKLNMKRGIALLLVFVVLATVGIVLPTSAAEQGSCGSKLTWTFDQGTLTIVGEGAMTDFNEYRTAPWYHLREQITKVILPDGLTRVGRLAFYGCTSLRAISLPDTVRSVGDSAFYECESLEWVKLSATLSKIERQAFYGCKSLASISLPISLESIGDKAFYLCRSLSCITIPRYASKLGDQIFAYCTSLLRVSIESNIKTLPQWMFYGCENLSEIALPASLVKVDHYALKRCDSLTGIYHPGDSNTINALRGDLAESNPEYAASGYIGGGTMTDSSISSSTEYDKDGNVLSQTNTTVTVGDGIVLVTKVESEPTENGNVYSSEITLTVDGGSWDSAADAVSSALGKINDDYSLSGSGEETKVVIYTDGTPVDEDFMKQMAGRDVEIEVVTPNGDSWRVDCSDLKASDVSGSSDFSYTVQSPPDASKEALGTDDCYGVTFTESSNLNTEILVRLPNTTANSNAYLYQVEPDGTHTRLQGSMVDSQGNAHFYVSSVNKNTQYIVGIDVPGEDMESVIIPDELSPVFGAIQRLEHIEYVETGVREFNGLTLGQVMLIAVGGLILIFVIVGVVMFMMNKRNAAKVYSFKK